MPNTLNSPNTDSWAAAIVEAHAARFPGFAPQPCPAPTQDDPAYLAALDACSTLGFIAADAECLACAWAARTQRTGHAIARSAGRRRGLGNRADGR